jgi:uncharacterized protein YggU (UPF0235/DUF167 family)
VIASESGEVLIRVAARAVDGKANREFIRFLAEVLGVPPSRVLLTGGMGSRYKIVRVEGITRADALQRIACAARPRLDSAGRPE